MNALAIGGDMISNNDLWPIILHGDEIAVIGQGQLLIGPVDADVGAMEQSSPHDQPLIGPIIPRNRGICCKVDV